MSHSSERLYCWWDAHRSAAITFACIAALLCGTAQAQDIDNDGLSDVDEVNFYSTDPADSDTDGDGIGDGGEVNVGLDPLDPSDGLIYTPMLISDGIDDADRPAVAIDAAGNIHVVYGNDNSELRYKMFDSAFNTLIDQTDIGEGDCYERGVIRPGSDGRVYLLCHYDGYAYFKTLDPSTDDQDGDAADPITLVTSSLQLGDSIYPGHPTFVLDSADNLHIVYHEDEGGDIAYLKLDKDENELVAETVFGTSWYYHPTLSIGLDSNENVHVAWSDASNSSANEIWYAMLSGSNGSEIIAATQVTTDDGFRGKHTNLFVINDLVTIIWGDDRLNFDDTISSGSGFEEVFLMRLDPSLDDQDGDPADPNIIKTVADTQLSIFDGNLSWYISAALAADGNIDVLWVNLSGLIGASCSDEPHPVMHLRTEPDGTLVSADRTVSDVGACYSYIQLSAIAGRYAYIREDVGGVESIVRRPLAGNNSVITATGTGTATVTIGSGLLGGFDALALTDLPASAQAGVPTDATFVDGFFGIVIDNVPVGGNVQVTLDLPGTYVAGTDLYYKWDAVNGWYTVAFTNGVSTNQVILTLTDGGAGDADGVANGQIVDPGGPGLAVAVPDVVGLIQGDAEAAIVGAGLVVGAVTTANSNTVPNGDVIGQNPNAGTAVAPGSTVDIEVSLGASVPDVVGLREATAGAAIVGAGLVVGTVTPANSNTVPTGDVISQAPGAGTNVAPGSAVTIVVSLGALVLVPDVAALSQANAEAAIVGAGLVVGSVITANSNTVPTGDVMSQAPSAGTNMAPGSAVIIVVSLGASVPVVPVVPVPDVAGLSQANAEAAIVGTGLVVGSILTANSNTVPTGDVMSQAPGAGTNMAPGSAVIIVVSLGASVTVPDVAGSSQANAEAAIVGTGLVVGSVITANSNTVPTGDVISQAPSAGTILAPGSAVTIVVSLGASVPDVAGSSQANAEAAIVGAGLVVGTVTTANSNTVPTGDVISQTPGAGINVAPGSVVAIQVSLGASVPQLTFGSSSGLFGCSVGSGDGPVDPTLPLLVLISVLYLSRRHWIRAWRA